jgi:hypothetical protein
LDENLNKIDGLYMYKNPGKNITTYFNLNLDVGAFAPLAADKYLTLQWVYSNLPSG